MGDTKTKFIDFVRVNRFDSIVSFYLVNLYNCMKTWKKEIQVDLFISLMSCKYGKKIKGLKHLFICLFSKANMFYFYFLCYAS